MIDPETGRPWQRPFGKVTAYQFSEQFWVNLDRAQRRCDCLVPDMPSKVVCGLEKDHPGKHRPAKDR
jgi:hypothetical protein